MAMAKGGQLRFDVDFNVNKSSLNDVSKSLQNIYKQLQSTKGTDNLQQGFKEAAEAARKLDSMINQSWNSKLNQLNLDKLNQSIKTSYGSIGDLKNAMFKAGQAGQQAFYDVATEILNTNVQLKESSKLLDSLATSMANTVKWGITSGVFNQMTGAIKSAYYYAKDLDTSLNNIRIVTGDSADQMDRFAKTANTAAKDLGRSTLDYTKAALSFYQQGLDEDQVRARTEATLKAQNITGIGTEMVDYMTAVWNGFKVNSDQVESYVDKLAKVADSSASDMSQLAIAMSKVAATANVMGVDVDQLAAQIATVIATTRQAPESVGTAFKTIYSRLNDISAGAEEAEISLGNYSGKMAQLGFNVLDANGRLRDTGQVIEQIGSRWQTLSKEQQVALANIMGGTRQVTQITALFENWTRYSDLLNESLNSQGTLNEKNATYMEGLAAQLQILGAETERTYDILFDTKGYNSLVNVGTKLLGMFNDFIDGLGGGAKVLSYFGSLATSIFSKQIANSILRVKNNFDVLRNNASNLRAELAKTLDMRNISQGLQIKNTTPLEEQTAALDKQVEAAAKIAKVQQGLTQQQYKETIEIEKQIGLTQQKINNLEAEKKTRDDTLAIYTKELGLQDANVWKIQAKKDAEQEIVRIAGEQLTIINKTERALQDHKVTQQNINELESHRLDLMKLYVKAGGKTEDFNKSFDGILTNIHKGKLELQDWHDIENKIIEYRKTHSQSLQKVEYILQNIGIDTTKLTEEEKDRLATLVEQNNAYAAQGQKVLKLQKAVRTVSAITQEITVLGNLISTMWDDNATGAEKANAAVSTLQGTFSAIGSYFGPIGLGIAGLANGVISLVKSLPVVNDFLEDLFSSTEEKIAKFQENVRKAQQQDSTKSKQISELQEISQEYSTLAEKAGDYGRNLNQLTEDERNRYHELTNKFTEYNKAVIEGYDDQGNAIVKGQQALQGTIELLRKAKDQAIAASIGSVSDIDEHRKTAWEHSEEYHSVDDRRALYNTVQGSRYQYIENGIGGYNQHNLSIEEVQNKLSPNKNLVADFWNYGATDGGANNPNTAGWYNYLFNFFQQRKIPNGTNDLTALYKELEKEEKDFDAIATIYNRLIEQYQAQQGQWIALTQDQVNNGSFKRFKADLAFPDFDTFISQLKEYESRNKQIVEILTNPDYDPQEGIEKIHYSGQLLYQMKQSLINSAYGDTSQTFQSIAKDLTDIQRQDLEELLTEYLRTFTIDMDGDEVRAAANQYLEKIAGIFDNTELYESIKQSLENNKESLQGLSTEDYQKQLIKIIEDVFAQFTDITSFDTKEQQDAFANLLKDIFHLDTLELNFDGTTITVDKDSLAHNFEQVKESLHELLNKTFNDFGKQLDDENFNILESLFKNEEVLNPEQLIGTIDWYKFFALNNGGMSMADALSQVIDEARDKIQGKVPTLISDLNLDEALNNDDLIKHIQKKKKLKDEQKQYLKILEQEFPELERLGRIQGQGSQQYLTYLKHINEQIRTRYRQELEIAKEETRSKRALAFSMQFDENLSDEDRKQAHRDFLGFTEELQRIKYQIAQIDEYEVDLLKDQTEQQKALNTIISKRIQTQASAAKQNWSNASSALDALKNGESLSLEQSKALLQVEEKFPELKQNTNKYSLQYINLLERAIDKEQKIQLATRENELFQEKKNERIAKYNELSEVSKQISENQNKLNKDAKEIDEEKKLTTEERTALLEQQLNLQQKEIQLRSEYGDLLAEEFALQNNLNDDGINRIISMRTALDDFNNSMDRLIEGQVLSKDQWNDLDDILDEVLAKYPELQTQVTLLHFEELAGTQAYAQAIQDVRTALNELNFAELAEEFETAYNKIPEIDINVALNEEDLQTFSDALDELINVDRVIDIEIETDAAETFARLQDEFDNLYDAAGRIGQNFIVAAQDLSQLNAVFPGIIEGMQLLDDGSYQLSANVVQRAIATAETTASADAESVKEQLQHQSTILHAKAEIYKELALAAYTLAGVETEASLSTAEAQEIISLNLAKLKQMNDEESAKSILQNQKDVTDDSHEEAKQVSENWASSASSAAKSIAQFASQAIENFKKVAAANAAAARGQQYNGSGSYSLISSTYSGSKSTAGGSNFLKNLGKYISDGINNIRDKLTGNATGSFEYSDLSKEQWKTAGDKFTAMALQAENHANKIDGYIAQLAAETLDLSKGLNNVYKGQGIKGADPSKGGGTKTPKSSGGTKTPKGSSGNKQPKEEKVKEPDFMEYLEDLPDRYHDIDLALKDISNQLTALGKQQKKLFGKDLIDNLNKQIDLLNQQIEGYQEKIILAKQERNELQETLKQQGVLFDSNTGAIANYAQVLTDRLNGVNAVIEFYNTLSEEEQKQYKETVEQVKEDYEEFKKQISRYDEIIHDLIPDLQQSIHDARDEQIEMQISKFTMSVEIDLDLAQAERDWNKFKKKVIDEIRDDDILGNVRSRMDDFNSYYKPDGTGQIASLTDQVTQTAQQIQQINQYGTSVHYGDDKARALEDLKNYSDQLMASLQDVEDIINDVKEAFFDMVDAAEDAFAEQVKEYDFIDKLINHDKKLIELVYGDQAYDKMNNYYEKARQNDLKELDFQRQEKDFWWEQMQIEKARMNALQKESNEYKEAEQRFKALEQQWMSAVESFNSKLEESIEHLLDEYKNNVSLIFQDLEKKLTDGKSLEYIGEEWELINMNADRYLDKINSMYALQQLQNSYRDAINNSKNNVKAQQSLNALMQQQLGMLAEREKISQYDVDRANMLLQVQIQRLALEEARNAKSKLRLRRDAQGNYSYQYTADEDNVAEATQGLMKAQADVYNLDRNKYRQNLDAIYQMQTEFNDKLKALYEEYPVWTEQAEAKKQLLVEQYGQAINDLTRDNNVIRKNLQESTLGSIKLLYDGNADSYAEKYGQTFLELDKYYKQDIGAFKGMTDADSASFSNMATDIDTIMGRVVPGWTGGIQSLSDKISKQGGFIPSMSDAFTKLDNNTKTYQTNLGKLEEAAGVNFAEIGKGIDTDIGKTETLIKDNKTLIQDYKDSFQTYRNLVKQLNQVVKKYDQIKQAAIEALKWTRALWQQEQKKASQAAKEEVKNTNEKNLTPPPEPNDNPEPTDKKVQTPVTPTPKPTPAVQQPKARAGSLITYSGKYYYTIQPNLAGLPQGDYFSTTGSSYKPGEPVIIDRVYDNNSPQAKWWKGEAVYAIKSSNPTEASQYGVLGWITESQIQDVKQYDTGGYTGSWGNSGKIGMLHEKQLVLNKQDTENILRAVDITRTMQSLLSNLNFGMNPMLATAGPAYSGLDQNVVINASFPNASNRYEIEKAFENLLNRASQYVATSRS